METTIPQAPGQQPPDRTPRSLHEICEDVRRAECGACPALPFDECVYTTAPVSVPAVPGTRVRPVRGYHVNRFAIAEADGLITIADMAMVLEHAGSSFTSRTVIFDDGTRPRPEAAEADQATGDTVREAARRGARKAAAEAEDTRRLAAIREVLRHFDWEHHDRQLALEAIERIAEGGQA